MYPRQPGERGAWVILYEFLQRVQSIADLDVNYSTVGLEEIELVLLAAEKAQSDEPQ